MTAQSTYFLNMPINQKIFHASVLDVEVRILMIISSYIPPGPTLSQICKEVRRICET